MRKLYVSRGKTGWARTDGFEYDIMAISQIEAHVHIKNLDV